MKSWMEENEAQIEETAKIIGESLGVLLESSGEQEDIISILEYDDTLMEAFADKLAFLNILEMGHGKKDFDAMEAAYLSLMDTCFEMAKVVNPLAGFGKDRLLTGLKLGETFVEKYWNIVTNVSAENLDAFAQYLPEELLDDVRIGKKFALGALRREDGASWAAGAAVYHIDIAPITGIPVLRIDWIYVGDAYRSRGVGNFLMAQLLQFALKNPRTHVSVEVTPVIPEDPIERREEEEEFAILEAFLDSWKFDFSVGVGQDYLLAIQDVEQSGIFEKAGKNVGIQSNICSIKKLGKEAGYQISHYLKGLQDESFQHLLKAPLEYYDTEASCVLLGENSIRGLLLLHRFPSGNLRLEVLSVRVKSDARKMLELLCFAYTKVRERGERDRMLMGTFYSEEGIALMQKLCPAAQLMTTYEGILAAPADYDVVTAQQWERLRQELGLSDKLADEDLTEADLTEDALSNLRKMFMSGIS